MTRDEDGVTKAMYLDKKYYLCVVLSESGKTASTFSFINT